jgi:hypothetical protein
MPSWADGPAKTAIRDFVDAVTLEGGADFAPPSERIAVFDNDGTLWCERPLQVQFYFALARLQAAAATDPTLRERQPFKAFLENDLAAIAALGKKGILEAGAFAHSGMTEVAFDAVARDWLESAKNPTLGRRFLELVYAPQIELLGLPTSAALRSTSSPAAGSTSCAPSPKRRTASPRIGSSARASRRAFRSPMAGGRS